MKSLITVIVAIIAASHGSGIARQVSDFPDVPKTHWAYQAVTQLKQKGILLGYPKAPPQANQQETNKALALAIQTGDVSAVKSLLAQGANPNARYPSDPRDPHDPRKTESLPEDLLALYATEPAPTVLMHAVDYGRLDITRLLVKQGADVNAHGLFILSESMGFDASILVPVRGATALHVAAVQGHTDLLKFLLRHGVQIDARDKSGWTPLMWAVSRRRLAAIKTLLRVGANRNLSAGDGTTALMLAVQFGGLETVNLLLAGKCNVNAKDIQGNTALKLAAQAGEREIYDALKRAGAKGQYRLASPGIQP